MASSTPNLRHGLFLLLLVLVSLAFVGLIQPFLMTFFWAVVLAIIFRRSYRLLRVRLRGRDNLAASLTVLFIVLLVIVPIVLVMVALVDQGQIVVEKVQSGEWDIGSVIAYVQSLTPRAEALLGNFGLSPQSLTQNLNDFLANLANTLADQALQYTQNVISLAVEFFLMLYLLFFFIRDGRGIVRTVVNAVPMGNAREYQLVQRFAGVVRATLKGTVIVAVIQGSIGGLMFALLGIEGALFWGVVMVLLSFLPVGGSTIVWAPAAVILLIQGEIWKAVVLIAVGSLIIGLVDNLLRPMLVGRDTRMPDYLILLATLGGIAWFGLSGFILGPVIAALFLTCWEMAGATYGGTER